MMTAVKTVLNSEKNNVYPPKYLKNPIILQIIFSS